MRALIPVLIVLHVVPAAFWFGLTGVLANLGAAEAALPMRRPQLASALVAIAVGALLWWLLHAWTFGIAEKVLAFGAVCAVAAVTIQQAIAWPAAVTAPARFAVAQKVSAVLAVLTLIAMLVFRYV